MTLVGPLQGGEEWEDGQAESAGVGWDRRWLNVQLLGQGRARGYAAQATEIRRRVWQAG